MADLSREVDEELRAEQARLLARRILPVILVLALLVLGAVAAWQGWEWRARSREAALSAAYLRAMQTADQVTPGDESAARDKALAAFRPLEAASAPGVRTLARLRAAQLLADKGDGAGAVAALDSVAADRATPRPFRDLATLLAVQHQMDGDPAALKERLATMEEQGGAFRSLGLETGAMIDVAHGRTAEARRTLQLLLADGGTPTTVRERAQTLLLALDDSGVHG